MLRMTEQQDRRDLNPDQFKKLPCPMLPTSVPLLWERIVFIFYLQVSLDTLSFQMDLN